MYKKVEGRNGVRWLKDGRFVKASEVPEDIKQNYVVKKDLNKKCVVCGDPKEHQRIVLGMMVALCDSDYYNLTYGAIAGLLKKKGLYGIQ